jgi:hypothetical protein
MLGKRLRQARTIGLWWLGGFCLLQVGLDLVQDEVKPVLRDPEYGTKLGHLKRRLAERPGQPLALVMGSSRVLNGFRPDLLPPVKTAEGEAVVFNFGLTGAGGLRQLTCLRRLLAAGVRPRWLIVEVMPAMLPPEYHSEELVFINRTMWRDLPTARRYARDPDTLTRRWLKARLLPWFNDRFCLMTHYAPDWVPYENRVTDVWNRLDGWGWMELPEARTPEEKVRAVAEARDLLATILGAFHIAEVPDRAFRELLELCRQEKIETALLLMPEGPSFRAWYPPHAEPVLQEWLGQLRQEYGVPVIDARRWFDDESLFRDNHHLLASGAARFTERFGRQALRPWLTSQPLNPPTRGPNGPAPPVLLSIPTPSR